MLALLLILGAGPVAAPSAEQARLLAEAARLAARGRAAHDAGDSAGAVAALAKALAIEEAVLGRWHGRVEVTADSLAEAHKDREAWAEEAACRSWVLASRLRLHGGGDHRAAEARAARDEALRQPGRTAAQRRALARSAALVWQAAEAYRKRETERGLALASEAVELAGAVKEAHLGLGQALTIHGLILQAAGRHKEALTRAERARALFESILGRTHPAHAQALNNVAALLQEMGDLKGASPKMREAVRLIRETQGAASAEYATALNNLGMLLRDVGELAEALRLLKEALALRKAAFGEKHPSYAVGLNNLAMVHQELGGHKEALALYERALAIRKAELGERHPLYADALNNLASLRRAMGDHAGALPLLEKALAVRKATQGERHPQYAQSLNNLGTLLDSMGDYRRGLPLLRRAMALRKAVLGRRHPDYAESVLSLGVAYKSKGDDAAALPLLKEAAALRKEVQGERHPGYAAALIVLASLHFGADRPAEALPLFHEALRIREEVLGRKHADFGHALAIYADALSAGGRHKEALRVGAMAAEVVRGALGEEHPNYGLAVERLAGLHQGAGDYPAAVRLYGVALPLIRASRGPAHPDYARALAFAAVGHMSTGRPSAAVPLQEEALRLTARQLGRDAAVLTELQQLAALGMLQLRVEERLSMPDYGPATGHAAVLAWKGAAFAAQQTRRLQVLAEAGPETRALAEGLRDATRSLALLSRRDDEASAARIRDLAAAREEMEARLADSGAAFAAGLRPPTSAAVQAALPAGVALVDFAVYAGLDPAKAWPGQVREARLAAWVLRRGRPVRRLALGRMAPIVEALTAWRGALEGGKEAGDAPARLRSLVWAPLEAELAGARQVLISPDGALGRLPWAALPGSKEGAYLIEEVPLALLPIPRILASPRPPPGGRPSLLMVGGVAYGEGEAWAALPATGPEAEAVSGRFRRRFEVAAAALSGRTATRAAVREALPRHRYAHLATHGFFAPETMRPALEVRQKQLSGEVPAGWHPGLLSGLVFAGANRPTPEDDGVLTALEIAEMDLSGMELAVLSACQTGLGKEAAGEGMLGLQRAFAVAGCRSVVSSLWSVHDAATSVLMERFYLHLWDKKLSKIQALRQAQIDILHNPEWVLGRVKSLSATGARLRGVGKASEVVVSGGKVRRSPAAWWAAWQLSGDWR